MKHPNETASQGGLMGLRRRIARTLVGPARSFRARMALSLGATLAYILAFVLAYNVKWIWRSAVALSIVPIIVVANAFGLWGGLVAGLASIPLNWALFVLAGESDASSFLGSNFWFTHIVLIVIGVVIGYLNKIRTRLERELNERKNAEERLRQHTAQLEALRQVGLELTSQLDLDALLHSIASRAVELLGGTEGGLYFHRPDRDVLEWAVSVGPSMAPVGAILRRGEGLSGKIWETGEPLIVDDYQKWEGRAAIYEGRPFKAVVGVPVRRGEEFLGVLNVVADPPRTFSPDDAELLALLATQAAVAIENARLYKQAQQEIAERVRAEEALKVSESRYRTLFDSASDAIFVHDLEGHFLDVNRVACERLGYSREELLQMTPVDIDSQEYADLVPERLEELRQRGHFIAETAHVRRDGTIIPVELSSRVTEYAGRPAVLSIARDITKRKRAEEEREKLIEELDAFALTVAHDLKNPLNIITGFIDLLIEDRFTMTDEELLECLATMARTGHKMRNIIDELLLLARVGMAEEVEIGPLDMASIVAEAQERLAHTVEGLQAKITLPETWPAALGHGPWIEEVWVNYFSNALQYGGRPPCVELGATEQADGTVRFWVRDNGPGIAPKDQAHLFTPFTQLGQIRAKGHGLGLSIVRRIVERLDGEVGVESEVGEGSEFYFTLPAV